MARPTFTITDVEHVSAESLGSDQAIAGFLVVTALGKADATVRLTEAGQVADDCLLESDLPALAVVFGGDRATVPQQEILSAVADELATTALLDSTNN